MWNEQLITSRDPRPHSSNSLFWVPDVTGGEANIYFLTPSSLNFIVLGPAVRQKCNFSKSNNRVGRSFFAVENRSRHPPGFEKPEIAK